MPVEIYVGKRRLEELTPEERQELGKRISEGIRQALQAWVNDNFEELWRKAAKGA